MELAQIEKYIIKRLENELKPIYYYHSIEHTLDVVNASEEIAKRENISEKDIILIKTAAYLHDIGIIVQFKEHEKHSVTIAKEILPELGYNHQEIEVITGLIHSTQMPQIANNLLQEIICDADLDYLGRDDYFEISSLLRKEWAVLFNQDFTDAQWFMNQVKFLSNHVYHTASSRKVRNEKKLENIIKVQALFDNLM
jgi:uncharacterized protein